MAEMRERRIWGKEALPKCPGEAPGSGPLASAIRGQWREMPKAEVERANVTTSSERSGEHKTVL